MRDQLKHVRHGFGTVRPYVYGGLDVAKFAAEVLGGVELVRHAFSDSAFHLEYQIGDSVLVLEASDPPHASATASSVYVYVEDVDAVFLQAMVFGAVSIAKPADQPYGERVAGVQDSFGNTWWLATLRKPSIG